MQSVVRHAGQESIASLVKFLPEDLFLLLGFGFCLEPLGLLPLTVVSSTLAASTKLSNVRDVFLVDLQTQSLSPLFIN